jgi:hypothetical protein
MTDMENKAREYAEKEGTVFDDDNIQSTADLDLQKAFLAGASYALANQWRDTEKEKPEYNEIVIAKIRYKDEDNYHYYTSMASIPALIRCWIDEGNRPLDDEDEYGRVVAWLEIPEYKPKGE